jgi:site-specific DNA recombinase|nr:MAG TPA: integrase [Caudoviricetes sp.]
MKKIAAAYIRVSTHMQEELSPDAQIRLIKEWANGHGYDLPEEFIFIDKGISGRKVRKRPSFLRMISMAKSKPSPFDAILVWKFSRFARNQEESIVYKAMLRNKHKIDVISISEPISDDVYGGLIERIIEWMDEFYSIRLAEDVKRGMTENALRGNFQSSPAFGYKVEKGQGLVIVEDQANIVRMIFNLYANSGMGFYDIARHLNRLGCTTKKGGAFETRTIKYIIQNPIYKGYLRWNYANGTTHVVNDETEWIIVKSPLVPVIVPEELWDRANERLKNEYHPKNGKPVSKHRHWLSGLVKCSSCGASLSTSVQYRRDRTYINFQCYKYLKGKCMVSHGISEKKLVPLILNVLKEDMNKSYIECERIEKVVENQQDILDVQLKRLDAREVRIKEAYLNGVDSLAEYKSNKEQIQQERELLLQQSQNHDKEEKGSNELPNKIRGVYDILVSDQCSKDEKQTAIRSIVKKIVFDKENKTLDFHYYIKED